MTERMTEPPTTNTDFWYVDVSAVRIQTWLGRTGAVRLRRGASYRLTSLSSKLEVEALLASQGAGAGVEWNDEAGEVSGVICLRFPAAGLTEEQDRSSGVHELQRGEVIDEAPVDGGLEREVELVDGLQCLIGGVGVGDFQ